jgi:hypothetical protein
MGDSLLMGDKSTVLATARLIHNLCVDRNWTDLNTLARKLGVGNQGHELVKTSHGVSYLSGIFRRYTISVYEVEVVFLMFITLPSVNIYDGTGPTELTGTSELTGTNELDELNALFVKMVNMTIAMKSDEPIELMAIVNRLCEFD